MSEGQEGLSGHPAAHGHGPCEECARLIELYEGTKQTARQYWLMTEIFVAIHGSEVCPKKDHPAINLEEKITLPVCGRCHERHDELRVYPLNIPSEYFTHFATCPTTGQPIMFHFEIVIPKEGL